jgi:hypothetical protein
MWNKGEYLPLDKQSKQTKEKEFEEYRKSHTV